MSAPVGGVPGLGGCTWSGWVSGVCSRGVSAPGGVSTPWDVNGPRGVSSSEGKCLLPGSVRYSLL